MGGKYVPSLLAAIGGVIETHMKDTGFLTGDDAQDIPLQKAVGHDGGGTMRSLGRSCPKCSQPTLIRQEGCDSCPSCGYSKCG